MMSAKKKNFRTCKHAISLSRRRHLKPKKGPLLPKTEPRQFLPTNIRNLCLRTREPIVWRCVVFVYEYTQNVSCSQQRLLSVYNGQKGCCPETLFYNFRFWSGYSKSGNARSITLSQTRTSGERGWTKLRYLSTLLVKSWCDYRDHKSRSFSRDLTDEVCKDCPSPGPSWTSWCKFIIVDIAIC